MMKTRPIYFFLFGLFFVQTSSLNASQISNQEYINLYKDIAMQEMKSHKIPASITLAQGLLESGSGNSRLAVQGNNHFGIKCKKNWTGLTIIEDDDEKGECFRAYSSAFDSYEDHSQFLKSNPRYEFLFDLHILDYKGWAEGLRKAGYATNQKYPQLLIGLIERLQLAQYDTIVFYGKKDEDYFKQPLFKANIQIVDNGVPLTVARPGQTVHSIAKENNMRDWQIYKYNDLPKDARIDPGMVIYLKPKRNKASIPSHTVEPGESMWEISQKYGIKLKKLYKKNRMEPGTEVKPGEVINMRRKRKEMPDTGSIIIPQKEEIIDIKPTNPNNKIEVVTPPQQTEQPVSNSNNSIKDNALYYTVNVGETLYGIAKKLNVSIDSLITWNNIINNTISVGQNLKYYIQTPSTLTPPQKNFISHTVSAGETLYSISRIYGVTVDEIIQWNNLEGNDIKVGRLLKIEDRR
ncbi:MAG: LysM peptidoglycan-binding domain-containing protein [Bacteroidia bacterium]|nr:LysM peptidoglycan-binding domain-containing protein [Bacteroidia bacterium]